ncbi:MAG: GGDEF domain-containing protein [Leptolyngbyaceae cyanobacterium]
MTVLHRLEPEPHVLSGVMPVVNGIFYLILLIVLYRQPQKLNMVLWTGVLGGLGSLLFGVWYFTLQAAFSRDIQLIDTLPPMSAMPLGMIMGMFVFARNRQILIAAIATWLLIALPILIYLACHHEELFTPRGLDLTITLGPVTAILSALIPFHSGVEQTVTSLRSERAQMQALAERDPLTQLYNRRGMESFFTALFLSPNTRLGVILFDIDHFKTVNDRYGHDMGDRVLQRVTQRCSRVLRQDDRFARWGGEEFLVVIPGVGDGQRPVPWDHRVLNAIAEELRIAIATEAIEPVGQVTASFGVTRLGANDTIDSVLKRVDQAMYQAKQQGRNRGGNL